MSVSHCRHIIRNKIFFFFLNEKNFGPIVAIAKSGEKSRDNFRCTTVLCPSRSACNRFTASVHIANTEITTHLECCCNIFDHIICLNMKTFPQLLMLKCALYNSNIVIVLSKELFTSFDVLIRFF